MDDVRELVLDTADRLFGDAAVGWAAIEESGLALALVPAAQGGFGLDPVDALMIVRRAGYHALPLPLAETMLARRLLALVGVTIEAGAAIATGDPRDDVRVTGEDRVAGVLHGIAADEAVEGVIAAIEGQLVWLPRGQWQETGAANLAGEPRATIRLDGPAVVRPIPLFDAAWLRRAGAALRTIQIAGAAERVLAMTIGYAGERVQFGKPIGRFQAVQHLLAVLAGQASAASAAADIAADALAGDLSPFAVAVAKTRAGEAAGTAAAIAHQVHGAIGITREHDLHRFTKRLWAWRDEFGGEGEWARVAGRTALAAGAAGYWPLVTAA